MVNAGLVSTAGLPVATGRRTAADGNSSSGLDSNGSKDTKESHKWTHDGAGSDISFASPC